jgi:large exoprotein involved in heme utilization and adhesion
LGVLGEANLFLLNPNGILFGLSASLDVQGSFVATTANAIQFPNGEVFSASTPSAPSSLLTINPSAFFFNQVSAGAITNYSRTPVGATPDGNQFGLRVPDGQSLLLVGGDIVMDGGGAIAQGGRIELGAIAGSGTVELNVDGNDLSLSFPDGADRADISLGNGALVSVNGEGGGDIQVEGRRITLSGGSQIRTVTLGAEKGGTLVVTASDAVEVIGRSADGQRPSGLSASSSGSGDAGELTIDTGRLLVRDGTLISSRSFREGTAGDINITARDTLQVNNGTIRTNSTQSPGGAITINAGDIRLFGDSDIISNVASGADNGGNIDLEAGSILAFDDSDILAFARDGRGGDITFNTSAFFGENYRPAPLGTDPDTLDGNNRVDINATGTVASGTIALPDTTFIQNSLTELPDNQIDTDSLLANSCIVRRNQPTRGSFTITGTGGLPQRPGDAQMSSFPTVDIETLPSYDTPTTTNPNRSWQKGDPIVEPQGVYRLPNGNLVMSRECS